MDQWLILELVTFVSPVVVYFTIQAVIGGVISVSRWLISGQHRNDDSA